jgi:phosphopentomutase
LGLAAIDGSPLTYHGEPTAMVARLQESSRGKDTTTGHWELAGLVSQAPLPTYPEGFPDDLLTAFSRETGRGVLCNKPYSGTQVIADYGEEHRRTSDLIVYTSADSVFQIAAHEDIVPPEQLYEYCRIARRLLTGPHAVGRVIARPFIGEQPPFSRTDRRRDFSLEPPAPTLLDAVKAAGMDCIGVGKIHDIFAGRGLTRAIRTHNNADGMACTARLVKETFHGLCFVNLVDFDMVYGHRNDIDGYAVALAEFDRWLSEFLPLLRPDDVLMITADHGCDPAFPGTDHTREMVPLIVYGDGIVPGNRGTLPFTAVADMVREFLGLGGAHL